MALAVRLWPLHSGGASSRRDQGMRKVGGTAGASAAWSREPSYWDAGAMLHEAPPGATYFDHVGWEWDLSRDEVLELNDRFRARIVPRQLEEAADLDRCLAAEAPSTKFRVYLHEWESGLDGG